MCGHSLPRCRSCVNGWFCSFLIRLSFSLVLPLPATCWLHGYIDPYPRPISPNREIISQHNWARRFSLVCGASRSGWSRRAGVWMIFIHSFYWFLILDWWLSSIQIALYANPGFNSFFANHMLLLFSIHTALPSFIPASSVGSRLALVDAISTAPIQFLYGEAIIVLMYLFLMPRVRLLKAAAVRGFISTFRNFKRYFKGSERYFGNGWCVKEFGIIPWVYDRAELILAIWPGIGKFLRDASVITGISYILWKRLDRSSE